MSVNHISAVEGGDVVFIHFRPGQCVIVGGDDTEKDDWWMGQVISCEVGCKRSEGEQPVSDG